MRFRSRLIVNLDIFADNIEKLKTLAPKNNILAMIKANAYGHGAVALARYAITHLGIKEFGLATLGEALELRRELPSLEFEAYVFSDIQIELKESKDLYLNNRIIPIISNMDALDFILNEKDFKYFPISIKFNTGMNRLGLDYHDVEEVCHKLKKHDRKSIYHLLTHFSSAAQSMELNGRNIEQALRFQKIKDFFVASGLELQRTSRSNSGGIEQKAGLAETHIRPGLMLYGPSTLVKPCYALSHWTGRLISKLETYIIRVFEVSKEMPIGYGATPAPERGVIAIIALGYGDGFSTRYLGATLHYKGHEGKIVGRVNMDMAQVYFKPEALEVLKAGERFTIWGDENNDGESFLRFSEETGTIPYEIFCGLSARVPRIYHSSSRKELGCQ